MSRRDDDRGAAAVEFALVLPLLLLLIVGIVEFGRLYNMQTSLTAAARQGARVMAIQQSADQARVAATTVATSLGLRTNDPDMAFTVTPSGCTATITNATVTITYSPGWLTGWLKSEPFKVQPPRLTGKGVMRCNG